MPDRMNPPVANRHDTPGGIPRHPITAPNADLHPPHHPSNHHPTPNPEEDHS